MSTARRDVDFLFGPTGPYAEFFDGYEMRPGQIKFAKAVEACIRAAEDKPLVIEGPTGTGKSQAYLAACIAAILDQPVKIVERDIDPYYDDDDARVPDSKRRVLIVTGNIALQEQLITKDLPLLKSVTGWSFDYCLVKGRSNYVCKAALESIEGHQGEGMFDSDLDAEIKRLIEWAKQSRMGDKSEVEPSPMGLAWSMLTAGPDDCTHRKCAFYDECHYYRQRNLAKGSDVIVTNYAFLLTEIALRLELGAPAILLPEFDIVVCDEAHDMGEIARRFFATEIKASQFKWMARLLKGPRLQLDSEAKIAFALANDWNEWAEEYLNSQPNPSSVLYWPGRMQEKKALVIERLEKIVAGVREEVGKYRKQHGLTGSIVDLPAEAKKVVEAMLRPATAAEKYIKELDSIWPDVDDISKETVYFIDKQYLSGEDGDGKRRINYSWVACPFSAGELLKDALWDQCERVVITSATLATRLTAPAGQTRFEFVREDLGLATTDCWEEIVESPFDLQRNMGVYLCADLDPTNRTTLELGQRIVQLLRASGGRALCLFTSYRAMDAAYDYVMNSGLPFNILKQGESSRLRLTQRFREDRTSCLFATRSFFQGIDVQGESLSMLILDKIPFPAMGDPFIEKAKDIYGRSWFFDHSVPRALMAFRQAIGRLIRTMTDRGVCAVLDSRMAQGGGKSYGAKFRDAIPSKQYLTLGGIEEFFPDVRVSTGIEVLDDAMSGGIDEDDIPF